MHWITEKYSNMCSSWVDQRDALKRKNCTRYERLKWTRNGIEIEMAPVDCNKHAEDFVDEAMQQ